MDYSGYQQSYYPVVVEPISNKYGIQMTDWRFMIEIIWHSSANLYNYNIKNRSFKLFFVNIANVQLNLLRGYNK